MRTYLTLLVLAACHGAPGVSVDGGPDTPPDTPPGEVPHRGLPQIGYHGGHVLSSMRLVVITAPADPLADQLFAACDALVAGNYWSTVTSEWGLGPTRGCVHVTGAAIAAPAVLADAQMTQYIANAIAASSTPIDPDGQTMYLLYLPPRVGFAGNGNCGFSGYHEPYGTLGDGWGVVMRCQFDFSSILESLTVVGSHEILEAATDPDDATGWGLAASPGQVWDSTAWQPYSGQDFLVEVGDFCNNTHTLEGGFYFQRQFSNAAAARGDDPCVPALTVPYYNVTIAQDWYPIQPGQAMSIPMTGWANGDTAAWQVFVGAAEQSTPPPPTTIAVSGPTITIAGNTYNAMTVGQTETIEVTMGANAASGSWQTFTVYSFRCDPAGRDGLDGDDHDHMWRFGVYVP
jgi:hypothetical protein